MQQLADWSDTSMLRLLEIVADMLEGFVIADAEGRFVFVSRRWTEMTGLALEDVRGLYVHDITPDTRVDQVLRTGEALSGELVRVRSVHGGELPLLSYYTPLYDGETLIGCATVCALHGMDKVLDVSAKVEQMREELQYFREELVQMQGARYSIANIAGNSPRIMEMKAAIHRAARSVSTVIIQGETGSGKELVAHSVHTLSNRATKPFIKINCAAIPPELLESELFGYVGGAFTGANRSGKKGKFQMADKGTLYLDEINQIPLHLQPKLLRAIQEREVEPVGGLEPVPVDCRIVAASNVSLEKMVKKGDFREDLFYRLNVFPIDVPPLRERKEDVPLIADHLLGVLNRQLGMSVPGISPEAKQRLQEYNWPGNVRELRNVIERAMNEAWFEVLTWRHFEPYFRQKHLSPASAPEGSLLTIRQARESAERKAITAALAAAGGNRTHAAEILGITRAMLHRKLQKYGVG